MRKSRGDFLVLLADSLDNDGAGVNGIFKG